jgi:hypothetical protein
MNAPALTRASLVSTITDVQRAVATAGYDIAPEAAATHRTAVGGLFEGLFALDTSGFRGGGSTDAVVEPLRQAYDGLDQIATGSFHQGPPVEMVLDGLAGAIKGSLELNLPPAPDASWRDEGLLIGVDDSPSDGQYKPATFPEGAIDDSPE